MLGCFNLPTSCMLGQIGQGAEGEGFVFSLSFLSKAIHQSPQGSMGPAKGDRMGFFVREIGRTRLHGACRRRCGVSLDRREQQAATPSLDAKRRTSPQWHSDARDNSFLQGRPRGSKILPRRLGFVYRLWGGSRTTLCLGSRQGPGDSWDTEEKPTWPAQASFHFFPFLLR